jgi:hypothetical protein
MTSDMELGEMPNDELHNARSEIYFQRCYETSNRMHHKGRLALVREGLRLRYACLVLSTKQRVRAESMRTLPGYGKEIV